MRRMRLIALVMAPALFLSAPVAAARASGTAFDAIASSAAIKVMEWAATSGETRPLMVEHQLNGVTPEMITWWWDHIDDTERYKLWHPKDHIAFEWIVPPDDGHVGTIQLATEKIAGLPMALKIRWDDPKSAPTEFEHVLAASIINDDGAVLLRFTHEYEPTQIGVHMRSTFHVPKGIPWFVRAGLKKHNIEEMGSFPKFLPELYQQRAHDGK